MTLIKSHVVTDTDIDPSSVSYLKSKGLDRLTGTRSEGVEWFEDAYDTGRLLFDLATVHVAFDCVQRIDLAKDLPAHEKPRVATGVVMFDHYPALADGSLTCREHRGCHLATVSAPAAEFLVSEATQAIKDAGKPQARDYTSRKGLTA